MESGRYIYMSQKEKKKRKKLQILMMNSLIDKQLKNLVKEFIIRICSSFIILFYFCGICIQLCTVQLYTIRFMTLVQFVWCFV